MSERFNAIVADKDNDGKTAATLRQIGAADLADEDVLVDVAYSTVNYKDGLAVTGKGKICRTTPLVCGIDLVGSVIESRDPAWQCGDDVLVNGYGLSEDHGGGYAQKQRVRSAFLVRKPAALSAEECMALGTAGYTAMLSVNAIQDHGTEPADGPVLVSGAAGGVGSVALMLLSALGYEAAASTGRPETESYLRELGAHQIVARNDLAREAKPLEAETWAAAIDSVGDTTLATMLAQTKREGIVAACGLAGGFGLPASVMPFILRGVTLRGIDSVMASMQRRERAWRDLAQLVDRDKLRHAYRVEPLERVPEIARDILAGKVRGRVVIDVNA